MNNTLYVPDGTISDKLNSIPNTTGSIHYPFNTVTDGVNYSFENSTVDYPYNLNYTRVNPITARMNHVKNSVSGFLNNSRDSIKQAYETGLTNYRGLNAGQKTATAMDTVSTLLNAYNSYKANKLAKQQFNHAVDVHNKNWDAQRKQTNSQLEDRQKRRVEEAKANGRTTTSVSDYMRQYGI